VPFAASLSEHPVSSHAIGEVVGEILERLGPGPDLAVLFVTGAHTASIEAVVATVDALLRPTALIGSSAVSVLAGQHEAEEVPAIAVWAARFGHRVTAVELEAERSAGGWTVTGLDEVETSAGSTLLVLADPFSFPVESLLASLGRTAPGLTVVGGLASAARAPGGNVVVAGRHVRTSGAVGVVLDRTIAPTTVVSQGCRPIGEPFIVTGSERNLITELGGRPALDRLLATVDSLSEQDRARAAQGIHCGIVIDEHQATFARGDFLIRSVMGADRATKAVAIGESVAVGTTVQFHVRDADSADEDLQELLAAQGGARGALVFTCNGRGRHLFGVPDHDAAAVSDHLGAGGAVAGMFCAGEIGPVGRASFLHGFTASVALFADPTT